MQLPPGSSEPAYGPWQTVPVAELVRRVLRPQPGRPCVAAVDGRGAGGTSTVAEQLHGAVRAMPGRDSAVVHTDDIAWHHSFFDWAGLLADHVLTPLREGRSVSYRPPGWVARGRDGAVEVPAGLDLVVVEGVGAARRELAPLLDVVVWVQSDGVEAERRGLDRDVASGVNGERPQAKAFWDEWMLEELPFLEDQRPWERADVVVAGTTRAGEGEVVIAAPLRTPS